MRGWSAAEQTDAASDVDADDSVDIELGEGKTLSALDWRELLAAFYKDFSSDLDKAMTQMKGVNEEPQVTDYPCPKCGLGRHDPDAVYCKACGEQVCIPNDE